MTVAIRPCRDYADVDAIERALPTRGNEFHRQRFERGDASTYLLAWLDGEAVGHALLLPRSKYDEVPARLGPVMELNGLGVAEAARRRGVASALMDDAAQRARAAGATILGLAVDAGNAPALRLYEVLGYRRHPTLQVVDVWSWVDRDGTVHEQRDPCDYWTLRL